MERTCVGSRGEQRALPHKYRRERERLKFFSIRCTVPYWISTLNGTQTPEELLCTQAAYAFPRGGCRPRLHQPRPCADDAQPTHLGFEGSCCLVGCSRCVCANLHARLVSD